MRSRVDEAALKYAEKKIPWHETLANFRAGAVWALEEAAKVADRNDMSAWGIAQEIRSLQAQDELNKGDKP